MATRQDQLARRYVAWLRRRTAAIVVAHVALLALGLYLVIFHLPLKADFSYLLPQDAPAVRDLRKLEARIKAADSVLVVVDAPTPEARAATVDELAAGFRTLPEPLIERVTTDQTDLREFLDRNQSLLVPYDDLSRAHEALTKKIANAKAKANPLFIDIDDEPDPDDEAKERAQLDDLRKKRRDAQAKLERLSGVSADGKVAIIQLRTGFRSTNAALGEQLIAGLERIAAKARVSHPEVRVGFTGSVIVAVTEHRAIAKGMMLSSIITGILVALVLALYFRSAKLLVLLVATLIVSTVMAFGAAALTVGYLNAATAFLGAIIAGNGVNYGILLIARYIEERRGHDPDAAMATALAGTLRPTLIASLGAAIAYGSLAATSFKGFSDFALIGAFGMMIVWGATYVLLPALVLRFARTTRIFEGDPLVGKALVRVLGFRRSNVVVAIAVGATLACSVLVARYIANDPFEYDVKKLRSKGEDAIEARTWMQLSDKNFGRGITGRTVIAADRIDQVPQIVDALRAIDAGKPPAKQTIGEVWSIVSFVPRDQAKKLPLIDDLRRMIDDAAPDLEERDRAELMELRPPDGLQPITMESLPASLRERFTEKDGRVGLVIEVRPAEQLDEWDGRDLIRFASAVRELELADHEKITTSGTSVVFADIVNAIERDGLLVTSLASGGLIAMVILLVGFSRRAFAVLAGTAAGALLMVAVCALFDLKVNFLDFVALPITLGIGIDYAINVAHRQTADVLPDPLHTLQTSGSAVFVCSLTTIIGYASLLASDNLAIRGFGTASLIGEIACVLTALVLVPALLAVGRGAGR